MRLVRVRGPSRGNVRPIIDRRPRYLPKSVLDFAKKWTRIEKSAQIVLHLVPLPRSQRSKRTEKTEPASAPTAQRAGPRVPRDRWRDLEPLRVNPT
jgi:hypothetical protein